MFRQVRSAVSALEGVARKLDAECLDGHDAAELLGVVARGKRVCAAIETLLAGRVAATGAWRGDGHRTAAHWVAAATGDSVGTACRTLETARSLGGLPGTAEAFRSGELSEVQAAEIASAASADPNAEVRLLDAAARSSVKGLRDRCREVRAGVQADDASWAHRLHDERRAHDWTDPDGAYRLDGRLPPDAGARFKSAWHAHIERIARHARAEGRHEPRAAYAADALVALATDGPCKPPEVRVVVDGSALARGQTRAGERCEIDGIGPAPVTTALALLDDARVIVMARDGADITAVSRPTRVIPAKLRRALEARYPVCAVKSCDNERRLEIDHVVRLANGGRTELANLWRLCPHHHALKTHSAWAVVGSGRDRDLVPPDRARAPDRPDPPSASVKAPDLPQIAHRSRG